MKPGLGPSDHTLLASLCAIALAIGACGSDGTGNDGSNASTDDGGLGADDAGEDIDAGIPAFNGCRASDYVDESGEGDSRVITIVSTRLAYTPRCLLIATGQSVRFEGMLSEHPLAPGNPSRPQAGSPNTPIVATSSGKQVEFTFEEAGTFPYYCRIHATGDGKGMAGSIHVRDAL